MFDDAEKDSRTLGSKRISRALEDKNVFTIKASVRAHRNGIWKTIHLPKSLFEALQLRLVKERWPQVRLDVERCVRILELIFLAFGDALERALEDSSEQLRLTASPRLTAGRRTLAAHADRIRRESLEEVDRLGLPLPAEIEKAARQALAEPCRVAATINGTGTRQRSIVTLAEAAGQVGGATIGAMSSMLKQIAASIRKACQERFVVQSRTTLEAVATSVTSFLEAGSVGEQVHPDRGEVQATLQGMPDLVTATSPALAVDRNGLTPPARGTALSIHIGSSTEGAVVSWEPGRTGHALNNFGLLVTGDSGTGKTQILRAIIAEVVASGLPVCVFDFKNDYAESTFASAAGLRVHDVSRGGLPFNPMSLVGDRLGMVQPIRHVHEVADVLQRVFQLGDIQTSRLRRAMASTYRKCGIDPSEHVRVTAETKMPSLSQVVDILQEDDARTEGLLNRLSPLFDLGLFPDSEREEMDFEEMLSKPVVLDLHELPNDRIKSALAEIIILRLHGHLLRGEQPRELRRLLVFDEAWRVSRSERLQELGREGRAFGIGIALGTQFPGDIPEIMTGNLATQLMLHNSDASHRKLVAKQLCGTASSAHAPQLITRIGELKKHEGYFRNSHHLPYVLVRTLPHYQR
jgi:hypothetical protein